MKTKIIFFTGIVAIIILLLWMKSHAPHSKTDALQTPQAENNQQGQISDSNLLTKTSPTGSALPYNEQLSIYSSNGERLSSDEWLEKQFNNPMSFYGKVVDENGGIMTGAYVEFRWITSKGEGQSTNTTSDNAGQFSISGLNGQRLDVNVGKTGYYNSKTNQSSFNFYPVGREVHRPDVANPVVFYLRKRGIGVDLITSQLGVKNFLGVSMPLDGTAVHVDLLARSVGQNGQLIASQIKPEYKNWKLATNWSFKIEIPAGGFIEENDEFPFEAPENGYQPTVEFNFKANQPDWKTSLKKNYYFVFGNPPRFGCMKVETDIMWGSARLTYSINPDGLRNLEPK